MITETGKTIKICRYGFYCGPTRKERGVGHRYSLMKGRDGSRLVTTDEGYIWELIETKPYYSLFTADLTTLS